MAERPSPVFDILNSLPKYQFNNLTIFTDEPEDINELPVSYLSNIVAAYHQAHIRFVRLVRSPSETAIPQTVFPSGSIVLTKKRDTTFKDLYHSPHRYDSLPNWVNGYSNFKASVYVTYIPNNSNLTTNIVDDAHEFTHAVIPDELKIPAPNLLELWPTWIREFWSVGLHQRRPDGWLAKELQRRPGIIIPTINSITKNGIFAHDQNQPFNNIAYQYCVLAGEKLGNAAIPRLYPDFWQENASPYMAVADLTHQAYRNGRTLLEEAANLEIDLNQVEVEMRKQHNLI